MKNALTNLPGSGPDLLQQAKRLGIPGRSSMSVPELREAVGEAVKKAEAPRGGAAAKMRREMAAQETPAAESVEPVTPDDQEAAPAPQDFDSQLSELSAILSQVGQSPVQTAAASQQVAQAPVSFPNAVPNRLLGK